MVTVGEAAEEILKAAKETGANLIAMSTHGRSGLGRWALGSVTDKVLHLSEIPVLTVRAKAK
jgi:nucleotide-binding universal stress UspA family protein